MRATTVRGSALTWSKRRVGLVKPGGRRVNRLVFGHPSSAVVVSNPHVYKGFLLTARTFQVRGSGRWTLDVIISRQRSLRAFSSQDTFRTEQDAIIACWSMARTIIDRSPHDCQVSDLVSE